MEHNTEPEEKSYRRRITGILYLTAGHIALLLGTIGVFLPVLPTTPFVLLAAWFYMRSSDRLYQWLLSSRIFGPLIADWNRYGVIPLRAKLLATFMIIVMLGSSVIWFIPLWPVKVVTGITGLAVIVFIWSKPSVPPVSRDGQKSAE